ncbi:MAG: thiamine pyrophosphate-dependent dehydrogenase E1 component subunit alpha [Halobacteriales archaeon]
MVLIDIDTESGREEMLRRMMRIREFEEKAADLFDEGELPGFIHPYVGEEAVAVGACSALDQDDYITSTHRGHGHCIAKGLDTEAMMAELYGKEEGYCNGKGGSMHIADVEANMLGANGIVGAGPPIATGAAWTAQYRDEDRIALSFFGDGALAQGQVHEAINLAATWSLPAVILIENNQYGEATSVDDQHNIEDLSQAAEAYGIPGFTVDGMDVTAVYEGVSEARDRAIDGDGPTIIEASTYRYRGHFLGDHEPYRSESDVEAVREDRDPITQFEQRLIDRDERTEEEFDQLRETVRDEIEQAVEFAKDAEYPDPEAAYDDMYDEPVPEIETFASRLRPDGGEIE